MPRPPLGDKALTSTERARLLRERQQAAGLPRVDKVHRLLVAAAAAVLTVEERQRVLAAMLESVPEDERAGFGKVGAEQLGLPFGQ